jgi:transitional endoplasmic reticulum ATPase
MSMTRPRWFYAGAAALLVTYAVVAIVLWAAKDFSEDGPLSFRQAALTVSLPGTIPLNKVLNECLPDFFKEDTYKIVGSVFEGRPLYACYEISPEGTVFTAAVVDGDGRQVKDVALIKRAGAWRWIGLVKTPLDLMLGGFGVLAVLVMYWAYYWRVRPGQPSSAISKERSAALFGYAVFPVIGWSILARMKNVSRDRKTRAAMQAAILVVGIVVVSIWITAFDLPDTWSLTVTGLLLLTLVYGWLGGRLLLAPEGFGLPEDAPEYQPPPRRRAQPRVVQQGEPIAVAQRAEQPVTSQPTSAPRPAESPFKVQRPSTLPSFSDVGGMVELKRELKDTFGLMLAFSGEAEQYRITWNGVLLHGPPGVGKTFIARAVAGEFGLNFIHISTGDLVSAFRGESSRNVVEAFRFASRNVPCILFFDEFDSVAQSREDWPDQEARRTVNQLLTSLEEYRVVRDLIVMAATNSLQELDPAAIRPGRFDRHIRVDLPDRAGREAIFSARLQGRPIAADVDPADLAERSSGLTPAAIAQTVEMAAMTAFREAATAGEIVQVRMEHLVDALEGRGGKDRPMVEDWTWDEIVLPDDVKDELQQIQAMLEDPSSARTLGIEPPTGVLLAGPPGTGKTTIAKVLAAQAHCSFYPVSAGDITSKWLGESERNIQRLFRRARENRPSIIFIDEIDAIASRRGEWGSYDRQINELLAEMDGIAGQEGVFVIAATNRPDQLDPALVRGGRLSRTITIPLPDEDARLRMLHLMTERMPTVAVDLGEIARRTAGYAGSDLKALCQQAALHAMMRRRRPMGREPTDSVPLAVDKEDFDSAIEDLARDDRPREPVEG